jgi:hypothetical protein
MTAASAASPCPAAGECGASGWSRPLPGLPLTATGDASTPWRPREARTA